MATDTIIALGALAIALLSLFSRTLDKSLTIREHDEYKRAVVREIDRLESRINRLEETRPTTGELEARINRKSIE